VPGAPGRLRRRRAMSSLREQLALQAALKPAERQLKGKGRVSLLYDFHKAADIDAETVFNIALTGELSALPRLCEQGGRGAARRAAAPRLAAQPARPLAPLSAAAQRAHDVPPACPDPCLRAAAPGAARSVAWRSMRRPPAHPTAAGALRQPRHHPPRQHSDRTLQAATHAASPAARLPLARRL